jgi:predicted Rossmann fold nucleotide-binding protein DprA/Smf involved in DNA uptake
VAKDSIDRVKQSIRERLDELEQERDALMRALEALTGGGTTGQRVRRAAAARTSGGNGRKRGAGTRAPRGQRRGQVLKALEGGELGPSAIAREVGVNPTQISSLLRQLAAEGKVARTSGGKWALMRDGGSPPAADAAPAPAEETPAA